MARPGSGLEPATSAAVMQLIAHGFRVHRVSQLVETDAWMISGGTGRIAGGFQQHSLVPWLCITHSRSHRTRVCVFVRMVGRM